MKPYRLPSRRLTIMSAMSDIPSILPTEARKHYINLRNMRDSRELKEYNHKFMELKTDLAARGLVRSGRFMKQSSDLQKQAIDLTVHGYVEDALATCDLYDVPLTKELCTSLEDITRASLNAKYGRGPYIQSIIGNDWPAGALNQLKLEWDRESSSRCPPS